MAQNNKPQSAQPQSNSNTEADGNGTQAVTTEPNKRQTKTQEPSWKSPDGSVDVFLLERLFPDAHDVFRASPDPDPKSDCIVALDTNALLLPYSVAKDDLRALERVYTAIAQEGRLFLPERVAREFIKNRDRKLAEMALAIDTMKARINIGEARISPLLEGLAEAESLARASADLAAAKKAYFLALDSLTSQIRSWRGSDPVTLVYAALFTQERLARPAEIDNDLRDDWAYRVRNKVPPGYKDGGKDDTGIGDFLIWKALLNLGATHKKNLIFVTGEEKADWFVRAGNARVYPRPELIDEYRRVSGGHTLRLSSLHELLREMSAPETLVKDVEAAELTANTAIQASSFSPIGAFVNSGRMSVPVTKQTFDYSTHNGKLRIESEGKAFDLAFSKASDTSIHLYRSGTTRRIARVRKAAMDQLTTIDQQETSSINYTIQLEEGFLIENEAGDVLAGRIISISDDTRGADRDEVVFTYAVSAPGARVIMP